MGFPDGDGGSIRFSSGRICDLTKGFSSRLCVSERKNTVKEWFRENLFILLLFLALLVGILLPIGFFIHPDCQKNCQNQPAYFYNIPIVGTHYSSFYETNNDGVELHPSHSSSEEDGGGVHFSDP